MLRRILPLFVFAVWAVSAQSYDGPRPPKPDLPYLKHASDLVPTEPGEAREQKQKNETSYIVEGASSAVRTPLASPIFLFRSENIAPEKFGLYKFDIRNGRREIVFGSKKQPKAIRIEVTRLDKGLYKIEADDSLEPGEYSLSPEGSNRVFCFQVY